LLLLRLPQCKSKKRGIKLATLAQPNPEGARSLPIGPICIGGCLIQHIPSPIFLLAEIGMRLRAHVVSSSMQYCRCYSGAHPGRRLSQSSCTRRGRTLTPISCQLPRMWSLAVRCDFCPRYAKLMLGTRPRPSQGHPTKAYHSKRRLEPID
jgi:hypothetical protein